MEPQTKFLRYLKNNEIENLYKYLKKRCWLDLLKYEQFSRKRMPIPMPHPPNLVGLRENL